MNNDNRKKKGSRLPEDLENHPSIQYHFIRELPRVSESTPKIVYYLYAPIKAFILSWQLFLLTMFTVAAPEVYVVQVSTRIETKDQKEKKMWQERIEDETAIGKWKVQKNKMTDSRGIYGFHFAPGGMSLFILPVDGLVWGIINTYPFAITRTLLRFLPSM